PWASPLLSQGSRLRRSLQQEGSWAAPEGSGLSGSARRPHPSRPLPTGHLTSPRRSAPPAAARRCIATAGVPRGGALACRRGALRPRPVRSPPRLGPGPLLLDGSRVHHSGAHPTLSPACQLRILTPPEHTRSTRGATRRGGITKRTAPGCPPRECGIGNVFLPPHKSIPDESCVYRALETGEVETAEERWGVSLIDMAAEGLTNQVIVKTP